MTESEAKVKIYQILAYPQEFIMAHGGEGMQFLNQHIPQYSTRYAPLYARYNPMFNMYYNQPPLFYKILGTAISDGGTVDDLVNQMYTLLVMHQSETVLIENILDLAIFHHTSNNPATKPLFCTHFSNNDYFTINNTWFLHLDQSKWFKYKWMLWFTKVWPNVLYPESFKSVIDRRKTYFLLHQTPEVANKIALFDELYNRLIQTNANSVCEGHIAFIEFSPSSFTELPANYLDIPLSELIAQTEPRIPEFTAERAAWLASVGTVNKLNVMNYSQVFNLGYLEGMFDISGTEFNSKWIDWHTKNLEIISAAGYPIDEYQLG